ncbi:Aste57867_5993 [Aphanomyces stellatus]|uniref:Aste57867_5993 protein n=1 Tax=Aphanomyces stellatus TaxID=120398 RepID=A0A485KH10_9STRA|nr:hypothetical protein As57867_005979 [Aphanomyces stellatus]VFT83008.1 Aste57867_5993 [Aphanomyces stellatus]
MAIRRKIPAKRKSKNRAKGTLVTKSVSVDSAVYTDMILNKVVPAITQKFPTAALKKGVKVQQDNASPHKAVTTEFLQSQGVNGIAMVNQPPNSPDYNVLDLGFFNSIQSLQHQKSNINIDELISAVETSFYELPVETLSKTFITLQKVMELSMEVHRSNNYKLPHLQKDSTIKNFSTFRVDCSSVIFDSALNQLNSLS